MKERGEFACSSWLYGWNLGCLAYLFKEISEEGKLSSIGNVAKKREYFNDETFYSKLKASDFTLADNK